MTSRYDLLDQYIDARNAGKQPEFNTADDPELAQLIETVEQIDDGAEIEWPGNDFPIRMGRELSARLGAVSHARVPMDAEFAEDSGNAPRIVPGGRSTPREREQGGFPWYLRQFAGMAAAALVVALLVGGLAILYGDWGDRFQQPGATVVEPGDLPGTILYVEFDSANQQQIISRIDADGTDQQSLATRPSLSPDMPGIAWSPGGDSIAYIDPQGPDEESPAGITVMNLESGESWGFELASVEGATRLDTSLEWSPNAQSLVFTYLNADWDSFRLATIHVESGELQEFPHGDDAARANYFHPRWSPDGQRIAFTRTDPDENRRGIYVVMYGDSEARLAIEDRLALHPSWSPDGEHLAYGGDPSGAGLANVHVIDVQSGHIANVTNHDREDLLPEWSSRGQIAFLSGDRDGSRDIFLVNPNGSNLRNLTEAYDWQVFHHNWSTDGRYLTFTSTNESQDRWRINVYDIETDELYIVLERDNPLHHAQWRPDPDAVEIGHETEIEHVDIGLTDEQIEMIQRSVEEFLSDDETPAVRVNGDVITAEQLAHQVEVARATRAAQAAMDDEVQWPPEMRRYQEAIEALTEETGLDSFVLAGLIASSAAQQWADQEGLAATQEQIDEEIERQRDLYEQMREQVPEDQPLPQEITIDAIGEDRYWEEYLPATLKTQLTEWNVNQAALEEAGIGRIESSLESVERDLILAEFRAGLVREVEIEVLDVEALGDADLDRAIEYITETYPTFLREQLEQLPEPETAEDPALPGDAELRTTDEAEASARQYAEEEGRELGSLRHAHLITVDDYAAEYGQVPPGAGGDDALIWRVAFDTAEGESVFYLNAMDGSLISRAETETASSADELDSREAAERRARATMDLYGLDVELVSAELLTVADMEADSGPMGYGFADKEAEVWRVEFYGEPIPVRSVPAGVNPDDVMPDYASSILWFLAEDGTLIQQGVRGED